MAADLLGSLRRIMHALHLEFPPEVVYEVAKHVDFAVRQLTDLRGELVRTKEGVIAIQDLAAQVKAKALGERDKMRDALIAAREVMAFYAESSNMERDKDDGDQARATLVIIDAVVDVHPPSERSAPRMSEVEWLCDCGQINNPDRLTCSKCGLADQGELR